MKRFKCVGIIGYAIMVSLLIISHVFAKDNKLLWLALCIYQDIYYVGMAIWAIRLK